MPTSLWNSSRSTACGGSSPTRASRDCNSSAECDGDFQGDARKILRSGYDVHLHYADSGIRRLIFRLPAGLPFDRRQFDTYLPKRGVKWHEDKKPYPDHGYMAPRPLPEGEGRLSPSPPAPLPEGEGRLSPSPTAPLAEVKGDRGGILEINPQVDAGSYREALGDLDRVFHKLVLIPRKCSAGDLRPLYIAWLACNRDEEALEPPVPAGLGRQIEPLCGMAELYEIPRHMIATAAERSPTLQDNRSEEMLNSWLAGSRRRTSANSCAGR